MKFETAAQKYLECARKRLRPTSYATYMQLLNERVLPFWEGKKLAKIKNDDMQQFVDCLALQGRTLHVVRDCVSLVKLVLKDARKDGEKVLTNFDLAYPKNIKRSPKRDFLTNEEYKKLINYCIRNQKRCLPVLIAATTGLRNGEVCGLKWSDIDFATKRIRIVRSVKRVNIPGEGSFLEISNPKTESSIRTIPVPEITMSALMECKPKSDCFVASGKETPTEPRTLRQKYGRILRASGIQQHTFHALRHTFASRCINAGGDARAVADILGHRDVEMTLNVYTHSSDKRRSQICEMATII